MTVPVGKLQPNPWNPNRQSDYIFEKEINSIKKFGMVSSVLARQKGDAFEIIDGEHRWRAAKHLNMPDISINNLGEIPDDTAKQLTILMNEIKGKADENLMGKLIFDLSKGITLEELELNLPFDLDDIKNFIAGAQIDWEKIDSRPPEEEPVDESIITFQVKLSKEVAEKFRGQIERFKRLFYGDEVRPDITDAIVIEAMTDYLSKIGDATILSQKN